MNNEWTEETIRPYLFTMVEVSDDGLAWIRRKLVGYIGGSEFPFFGIGLASCYRYMRPLKEKEKVVEPWTFENCPWPLSVARKSGIEKLTFTIIDKHGAHMSGCVFTYDHLTDHFTQLDGKPCGIVKEVDA